MGPPSDCSICYMYVCFGCPSDYSTRIIRSTWVDSAKEDAKCNSSLVPRSDTMVTVAIYSKSVKDLVQWSQRFLRDPQALSSTLALLRMLQPRAFGSLKCVRLWTWSLTIIYNHVN